MLKKIFKKIPKLPLSALVFYLITVFLWKSGYIPTPSDILLFLENLYISYGLSGLFIASFLEGIVYFGLYFPGSFVVMLAVIISNGTFYSLLSISLVVATALTITSFVNYILGRKIKSGGETLETKKLILSKGLVASMLHPNALAFYFFNLGIKKQSIKDIIFVPIVMIPYGLVLAYLFYSIKETLKTAIENPYIMVSIILFWMLLVLFLENRNKRHNSEVIDIIKDIN